MSNLAESVIRNSTSYSAVLGSVTIVVSLLVAMSANGQRPRINLMPSIIYRILILSFMYGLPGTNAAIGS